MTIDKKKSTEKTAGRGGLKKSFSEAPVVLKEEAPSFLRSVATDGPLSYPNEPARFLPKDLDPLLLWCVSNGGSDTTLQSGEQVIVEIYGKMKRVTNRRLTSSELLDIVASMYGSESAKSKLAGDQDLDFPYEIRPDRDTRVRFRVNVTSISVEGNTGVQITARTIPSIPPKLSSLNIEKEIIDNMAPKQGLVVITGGTGSGKSTLLASMIRELAEEPEGNRKIVTYESPIEFVYDEVVKPTTSLAQTEIYKSLPSFAAGTRNALRRKPNIILVGEARDAETIGETVTASMTGHLVYTTVHSNGFADTIRRMVNVFNDDKASRAVDIISSLKMIVSQRLVPSADGKRIALREYVVFTEEIVDLLLDNGIENLTASCRLVLKDHGRSFVQDAMQKFKEGKITELIFKEIARGAKCEGLIPEDTVFNELIEKMEGPDFEF